MTDYPVVGSIASSGSIALSQGYFLALFDRTYPLDYLFPMKTTPNSGYELFKATAAMGERVSLAIYRLENGLLTTTAPIGSYATGTVVLTRPSFATGAVTIKAGTVFSTSRGGRKFILLEDVTFGSTDLGPHDGNVQAQAQGYAFNVPGERTAANGDTISGDVDTIYLLFTTPVYQDISFVVTQVSDMSGGTDPMLEALAFDRNVTRGSIESEEAFRLRTRSLADTVSPAAIERTIQQVMGDDGYCFREVGDMTYFRGFFYDGDTTSAVIDKLDFYDVDSRKFTGVLTSGTFAANEKVYLMDGSLDIVMTGWFGDLENSNTDFWMIRIDGQVPASLSGLTIVGQTSGAIFTPATAASVPGVNPRRFRLLLDELEFRAFFLVGLPRLSAGEFGLHFDDGFRNAYDYTTTVSETGAQNFTDGFPVSAYQRYTSVYDAILPIKAGGVGFDLYIEDISCP